MRNKQSSSDTVGTGSHGTTAPPSPAITLSCVAVSSRSTTSDIGAVPRRASDAEAEPYGDVVVKPNASAPKHCDGCVVAFCTPVTVAGD